MASITPWFVIINPTSGNGSARRKWTEINALLKRYGFDFTHCFTTYSGHGKQLAQDAVIQGFTKIICVGGDGTIHNIINGIMSQNTIPSTAIHLGVIPIGTGNDWVRSYHIPKDMEKAIQLIKNNNVQYQDIGQIEFQNKDLQSVYFNNLAGIGFDAHVVSKVQKYKHFGALAYMIGALMGMFQFKNFQATVSFNSEKISCNALMILVGLCRYSGGGMQLTDRADPSDGLFDLSIADNFSKADLLQNLFRLFDGRVTNSDKILTAKTDAVTIEVNAQPAPFIQADGELVGSGNFRVSIISRALRFYA
ncbi:MAG: diacylglycerol kinase family lipid kinase [Bacteroidia bacterium]|nr:diacylglycerol kinase family lipid kinase [Bacteroidia bacterium]